MRVELAIGGDAVYSHPRCRMHADADYALSKSMGYAFTYYTDEESYEITHETDRMVSILRTHYGHTGGTYPTLLYMADHFDLTTGEVLAVLVTASPVLPGARAFAARVRELCPAIVTLAQNVNPRPGSAVLGEREKILYGRGYIEDTLCGVRFRISPSSFYQINPVQTQVLYSAAIAAAKLTGKERVLDAYCGVGTIGLSAAAHAGSVVGVELNRSAAACAVDNAKANNIRNARFRCGDAAAFLDGMAARGEQLDVVFLDPPRAGSTPVFLDALCRVSPARAVYISCNPETQRRDLRLLAGWGWRARLLQPVDLFPHTEHVECVAVLAKIRGGGM